MEQVARTQLDVAFDYPIRLLANALGSPPADVVTRAHDRDVLVAALAGSARHARKHQEAGIDIVVAQGYEAGGHTGEIATMVLTPEIVAAVDPLPVLAAGGIGSGPQVAAALTLGAQGVWLGSIWLTTTEADLHSPALTRKLLAAGSGDTVRSRALTGKPARQLRTAWTDAWDDPAGPGTLPMPLQGLLVAEAVSPHPEVRGRTAARHPRRPDRRPDDRRTQRPGRLRRPHPRLRAGRGPHQPHRRKERPVVSAPASTPPPVSGPRPPGTPAVRS